MSAGTRWGLLLGVAVAALSGCRNRTDRTGMLEDADHRLTAQDSMLATTRQPMPIPLEPTNWPAATGQLPAGMVQDLTPLVAPSPSAGTQSSAAIKAPVEPRPLRP